MENNIKRYLLSYPSSNMYIKEIENLFCNDIFSFLIIKNSIIIQNKNILRCNICKTPSLVALNNQNKYKCDICSKTIDILKNTIFYSRKQPVEYFKIIKFICYYILGIKILQLSDLKNKYNTTWTIREMQILTKLNENQVKKLYKKILPLLTNYNNKPIYYFNILKKQIESIDNYFLKNYAKQNK